MGFKVSLCTTCKGRLHHLGQTLPENLANNEGADQLEFVILDYDSPDGLSDWVARNLRREIEAARVVYYRIASAPFYRSPHAKNLSHLVATGDVLVNLDADHFTGKGFALELQGMFAADPNVLVSYDTGETLDGIIAVGREQFYRLRGYDERLGDGWGYDDTDFRARAIASGSRPRLIRRPEQRSIAHSGEERVRYMAWTKLSQVDQLRMNMQLAHDRSGRINPDGYGCAVVYRNFLPQAIEVGKA